MFRGQIRSDALTVWNTIEKYGSIDINSLLIESLRDEKAKGFELIRNIKVLSDETEKTEEEFWRTGMRDSETKISEVVEAQKILRDAGYVVMDGREKVEHIKQTTLMMLIKALPDVLDYIIQSSAEKIEEIYCEQED